MMRQLLVFMFLCLSFTFARAQDHRPISNQNQSQGDFWGSQDRTLTKSFNKQIEFQDSINIFNKFSLDEFQGQEIESVTILAQKDYFSSSWDRALASLVVNKFSESSVKELQSSRQISELTFDFPVGRSIIGRDIQQLKADFSGKMQVISMAIKLKSSVDSFPVPAGKITLRQKLMQSFRGTQYIDLEHLLGISRIHNGAVIQRIVVTANASQSRSRSAAQLSILANNQTLQSKSVDSISKMLPFNFASSRQMELVIGQNLRSLELVTQGDLFIEEVMIVMEQSSHGGGFNTSPAIDKMSFDVSLSARNETIAMDRLISSSALRFAQITKIQIQAAAEMKKAQASISLLQRGFSKVASQNLSEQKSQVVFSDIQAELRDLELEFKGKVSVFKITVFYEVP